MNSLKIVFLLLLLTLVFVMVGYVLGGRNGMMIAFALALIMNFISYWFSDKIVLKMYRAQEINEATNRRLYRVVSMASQKAMLPVMPKVYIIPSKAPNAFATGRNESHATVAATEGLLEILNDTELEGVIGHELAHILNKDMLIGTIAATLAGAIGMLASMARWSMIFGGSSRDNNRGENPIALIVMMIVAPLAALLIQMAISRNREYKADAEGGRMTGQYLALASALNKLHTAPSRLKLDQKPATAHLFIANPLSGKGFASLFSTHPPVEERIKRLQTLAMGGAFS
ncbi:MAG: zinc metalloprotease HtpX [candidate division Zixibacteria bacterium]|nr:zinc metalloprotease HtpX [candidate division Zixibacteria bacterium]